MKKIYPLQKINLVERPEWWAYDMAYDMSDQVFNMAIETMAHIDQDEFEGLVNKVLKEGAKKQPWLDDGEAKAIYEAWQKNDERLEGFDLLTRDLYSWTWERAVMPTDGDIQDAIDRTAGTFPWGAKWITSYETLYDVWSTLGMNEGEFVQPMFKHVVFLRHERGMYDRYLIYDPGSSVVVAKLFTGPIAPEAKGVWDWWPALEVDKKHLASELAHLFGEIKEDFIVRMFQNLAEDMKDVDPSNRFDTRETWDNILSDKSRIKRVKQEINAFLEGMETSNG